MIRAAMNKSEKISKTGRKEFQVTGKRSLKAKVRVREVAGMDTGWL